MVNMLNNTLDTQRRDSMAAHPAHPARISPLSCLPSNTSELVSQYEKFARSGYATALRAQISHAAASSIRAAQSGQFAALQSILQLYEEELREAPNSLGTHRVSSSSSSSSSSDSGTCLIRMDAGVPTEDACQHLSVLSRTMSGGFAYPPPAEQLQDELAGGTATTTLAALIREPERLSMLTSLVRGRDMGRGILSTLINDDPEQVLQFEAEVPLGALPPSAADELILHASQFRLFHAYLCLPPEAEIPGAHFVGTTLFVDSVDALAARTYGLQGQRHYSEYRVAYALFMFWLWLSDNALDQYNNSLSNDRFVRDIMSSYASVFRGRAGGDDDRLSSWQATMMEHNRAGAYDHPAPHAQGVAAGRLTGEDAFALRSELIGNITNSLATITQMMADLCVELEGVSAIFCSHLESHRIEKTLARPTQYWEQMLLRLDSGAVEVCLELSRQLSLLEMNDQAPLYGFDQRSVRLLKHPYAGANQRERVTSVTQALEQLLAVEPSADRGSEPPAVQPEELRGWYTQVAHAGALVSPIIRQLDDHGTMYCVLINDLVSLAKDILEGEANPILIEVARRHTGGSRAWESLSKAEMKAALIAEGAGVCREIIFDLNERWNCLYAAAKTLRKSVTNVLEHVEWAGRVYNFEVQRRELGAFLERAVDHLIRTITFWIAGQNSWNAETPRYQLSLQAILRPLLEQPTAVGDEALGCLWDALFDGL